MSYCYIQMADMVEYIKARMKKISGKRDIMEMTLGEFWNLPEEKRGEAYQYLSSGDRFRVRMSFTSTRSVPCNDCVHRHGKYPSCDAFPEGITAEAIWAVMEGSTECVPGIGYIQRQDQKETI